MEHAPPSRAAWPTFVRNLATLSALGPFAAIAALALLAPGCEADVGVTGPSTANPLDDGESKLVEAINAHRAASGLSTLTLCASLNISASAHSDDMRDRDYQSDIGQDGSTTMSRACKAGYKPGCDGGAMAEVIASGSDDPEHTLGQWTADATAGPILQNPTLTILGVGRTFRDEQPSVWTVDFGAAADSSCQ